MPLNVVLIEPEIPNNTGNIGRLCLATGAILHLVKPFGFEITDSRLKRAGLDYWQHLEVRYYDSTVDFFQQHSQAPLAFLSSHGKRSYTEIPYTDGLFLVFGKESVGLSKEILKQNASSTFHIPIHSDHVRSLNIANAVAIVVYDGLKALDY
ncbi:MAG: tRNA (cytidine(34)-2'-O)-methyltransferase [Flavobacteriaceae bacterium]|nr:tRNA (cytidine(34)-2'-O)-methyltransferase [Flavobacteriaceae bacterium]